MYETILLPTDGSAGADAAVEQAITLAESNGATVHVLNVVDLGSVEAIPDVEANSIRELMENAGEALVTRVSDQLSSADIAVETAVGKGSTADAIIDYASEHEVDVIVMGTHGRSGIDRLLLGSVADRVIRRSPISVLIAK